jgi:ethanolaminephosphotransferase
VFLLSAVSVVVYVHLDCLDGRQARRTKSSSPLGQLFDHGCDALSVNLLLANIGVSLSMPCSWAHGIGNFGVRRAPQGEGAAGWGGVEWGCGAAPQAHGR